MARDKYSNLRAELPVPVRAAVAKMGADEQDLYFEEYRRRRRSMLTAYVLVGPFEFLYLNKTGLFFAFVLTLGGCGWWWFAELFLLKGRVHAYNADAARSALRDHRLAGPMPSPYADAMA